MLIEMSVGDLDGVTSVSSDYHTGETEVTFDPERMTTDRIVEEIRKAGYGAEVA
jgi:copper chaperone CopZ